MIVVVTTGEKMTKYPADELEELLTDLKTRIDIVTETADGLLEKARKDSDKATLDFFVVLDRGYKEIRGGESTLASFSGLSEMRERLRKQTIPEMLKEEDEFGGFAGYRSEKSPRYGYSISVAQQNFVSVVDKDGAFKFLREHNYGDAIQETVNPQRLRSIYTELQDKEIEMPAETFKVSTVVSASVRKSTKSS